MTNARPQFPLLSEKPGAIAVPGFLLSARRPMQALLERILRRYIAIGTLTVIWPDGGRETYGGTPGPAAVMRLHSRTAARRMLLDPTLALGELYMDGDLTVETGTIYDLMDVMVVNLPHGTEKHPGISLPVAVATLRRRLDQYNPADRARRNVAHHYDLALPLYDMFLDADRQYSCAYFRTGAETLDDAQTAKKRHIAAKLCLTRPGLHVLDIGCGWGGLALTLARDYGCRVTGITLSREQLAEAQRRAEVAGLAHSVRFELRDYRDVTDTYDRIVSVGMFEHVGLAHYPEFFATVARSLAPEGVALAAFDRAQPRAAQHQPLARQIHFSGRLFAGTERGGAGCRTLRVDHHRYRGVAPALCKNAKPLARPVRRPPR